MKILFEQFKPYESQSKTTEFTSPNKIKKLLDHNVSSIFIISSKTVDSDDYLRLVNAYRESGFIVHTIHIKQLQVDSVISILEKMNDAFSVGNCLVLSYGESHALTIITSFYIYTGKSIEEAKGILKGIRSRLIPDDTDHEFLTAIAKSRESAVSPPRGSDAAISDAIPKTEKQAPLSETEKQAPPGKKDRTPVQEAEPAPGAADLPASAETEKQADKKETPVPKKEDKQKKGREEKKPDRRKQAEAALTEEEFIQMSDEFLKSAHSGPFYRSLKFKLITIISSIIIVSMSGMIFIATYFFKNDNTVRVQENNLKFSEIISSKVSSELEKSIVIATTMLKYAGAKGAADTYDFNETDVLFSALATRKPGKNGSPFTSFFYNTGVMERYLVPAEKINEINSRVENEIARSFNGESLLHNVSQGLEAPVLMLSQPFRKVRGRAVDQVLVLYLKLDTLLKAFQTTGIVKPFMVNDKGDIIAHPDGAIVLSGGNLSKLPIVQMMMKSRIDNGQTRYSDDKGVFYLASFKKITRYGCGVISSVHEKTAYQEVYNIQRRNIYLMIIMLSTAILIVFFFGRSITTPIIRLVAATKQIIQGNYRVNIKPTTRDEIGELTFSFIEMGKGLEEREKIKNAFGKFVNKDIAEAAMRDELRLGGERKNVAIFFSDIRSFTAISENLEPEEVVEFLNVYMTRMVKCVEQHFGVVDKFIGDAIMAVWGTPISSGNDTENAINASLLMRKELMAFNKDRGGPRKPIIKIGCGINSGPVLAGQIGSEDRMEYTVIGDAVNLASRIESLNKPFGTDVLISEDSYALVKDIFAVEKMQTIKVKGKEAPQQIYAVLGRLDDPSRIKTIDELRNALGMEPQPFSRRSTDKDSDEEGEKKYEIIGQ